MRRWLVAVLLAGCGEGADVCENGLVLGQTVELEWTLPSDLDSLSDMFPQLMVVERVEPSSGEPGWRYTLRTSGGSSMFADLRADTCDLDFSATLSNARYEALVLGNLGWTGDAWAEEMPVQIRIGGPPYYSAGLVIRPH